MNRLIENSIYLSENEIQIYKEDSIDTESCTSSDIESWVVPPNNSVSESSETNDITPEEQIVIDTHFHNIQNYHQRINTKRQYRNRSEMAIREIKKSIKEMVQNLEYHNDLSRQIFDNNIKIYCEMLCFESAEFWENYQDIKDVFSHKFNLREFTKCQVLQDYNFISLKHTAGFTDYRMPILSQSRYWVICNSDDLEYIITNLANNDKQNLLLVLWVNLVSNHKYVHLALNPIFLQILYKCNFDHDLIQYYMFYGMYMLCQEELNSKKILREHRFIMKLDTAARFPISYNIWENNPYVPVSLEQTQINPTVIWPMADNPEHRGLYSLLSFQTRFNIVTDFLFSDRDRVTTSEMESSNFNWNDVIIGGSMIQACAFKNPLERLFGIEFSREQDVVFDIVGDGAVKHDQVVDYWISCRDNLNWYIEEYYAGSDLDMIIDIEDDDAFTAKVNEIYAHVVRKYPEAELHIIPTAKKFKYKILNIPISLEIFRVFVDRPATRVCQFHFPMVRNWYNGYNVWLSATSICSAYSGVFYEYQWLSNTSQPESIIKKYYDRGFYPILNEDETNKMVEAFPDLVRHGIISMSDPILRNTGIFTYIEDFRNYQAGINIHTIEGYIKPVKLWLYMKYINV